ncbi:MAG: serine/threonine protein kinase [Thermoanaerobaculia bacterium]
MSVRMATSHCLRCKSEIDRNFKACPHCGEPVTDFLRRYADEPVDGKYRIVERLGTGGMGEVYKATHTFLGTTRVIKVIRPQISDSQDAHDRFLREARAATKIQHPNVATLHDFSALPDGSHYMVWEYIDGENLAQRIRQRGTLAPRYAVQLTIQALQGLEAIHRAGIIHRDISPENLMITHEQGGEERIKIIDMGVAKVEGSTETATVAGVFVGKLRYASPEHLGFLAEGERIDGRADLYSMAIVLYEMLTGRPPFQATSPHEYVMLHSRDVQFKPLDLPPDLPGGAQLQSVLAKALERDRNKRYATAREFAAALEAVGRSLPDESSLRTMNLERPDTDPTWHVTPLPPRTPVTSKVDTLHRSTVRTKVSDAGATVRTPLPSVLTAAGATPQTEIKSRPEASSTGAVIIVCAVILIAAAAIIFVLLRRPAQPQVAAVQTNTVSTQTQPPAPAKAQTNVDVVSPAPIAIATVPPADTAAVLTQPASTTTQTVVAPPIQHKPVQPVVEKPRQTEPPPKEREPKPAPVAVRTYVEGGDSDLNDQLMSDLKKHLSGVKTVTVRGNGDLMLMQLKHFLQKEAEVTVADGADTVVDFNGVIERLGRGKKRRSAQATVSKNGRVIFRYEMPAEEYRVGDTPAEAFGKVLTEALH